MAYRGREASDVGGDHRGPPGCVGGPRVIVLDMTRPADMVFGIGPGKP